MLKSALNIKPSLDLSANFLYKEQIELGATYRLQDSFGGMINFVVTRIAYRLYDHTISDLKVSAPSSHEFILLYDLFTPKKVSFSKISKI
jgi:hypothetical protein